METGTEARRSLAAEKAESKTGDHWRDFLGPLRALGRGARTQANCQAMDSAQLQEVAEMLNMRS